MPGSHRRPRHSALPSQLLVLNRHHRSPHAHSLIAQAKYSVARGLRGLGPCSIASESHRRKIPASPRDWHLRQRLQQGIWSVGVLPRASRPACWVAKNHPASRSSSGTPEACYSHQIAAPTHPTDRATTCFHTASSTTWPRPASAPRAKTWTTGPSRAASTRCTAMAATVRGSWSCRRATATWWWRWTRRAASARCICRTCARSTRGPRARPWSASWTASPRSTVGGAVGTWRRRRTARRRTRRTWRCGAGRGRRRARGACARSESTASTRGRRCGARTPSRASGCVSTRTGARSGRLGQGACLGRCEDATSRRSATPGGNGPGSGRAAGGRASHRRWGLLDLELQIPWMRRGALSCVSVISLASSPWTYQRLPHVMQNSERSSGVQRMTRTNARVAASTAYIYIYLLLMVS